ncbi:MAG TPA: hypothetical protein VK993_06235 [Chthoniobacterales bacterium]|nr:hypothetical protein [Chthoniobacterales bacterium]
MSAGKTAAQQAGEQPTPKLVDMQTVEQIMRDWPKMARKGAEEMIGKYGPLTRRPTAASSGSTTDLGNAASVTGTKSRTTSRNRIPTSSSA